MYTTAPCGSDKPTTQMPGGPAAGEPRGMGTFCREPQLTMRSPVFLLLHFFMHLPQPIFLQRWPAEAARDDAYITCSVPSLDITCQPEELNISNASLTTGSEKRQKIK